MRPAFGVAELVPGVTNSTPSVSSVRHSTWHLCRVPRLVLMRNMKSSGIVTVFTPVIRAPPFEKLLRMQELAKRPSLL
jgi:hypothetical protein